MGNTRIEPEQKADQVTLARLLSEPMERRNEEWEEALRQVFEAAVQGLELLISRDICFDCFAGSVFWETQDGAVLVGELVKLAVTGGGCRVLYGRPLASVAGVAERMQSNDRRRSHVATALETMDPAEKRRREAVQRFMDEAWELLWGTVELVAVQVTETADQWEEEKATWEDAGGLEAYMKDQLRDIKGETYREWDKWVDRLMRAESVAPATADPEAREVVCKFLVELGQIMHRHVEGNKGERGSPPTRADAEYEIGFLSWLGEFAAAFGLHSVEDAEGWMWPTLDEPAAPVA